MGTLKQGLFIAGAMSNTTILQYEKETVWLVFNNAFPVVFHILYR